MKRLCIIPARGGSKRIPRKNIKEFLGKPIIAYSIQAALSSRLFDVVMVSTDDEVIAEKGREYGADIPFMRGDENADDYATTIDVIKEVLDTYHSSGVLFDEVVCLYATAPFVTIELLINAVDTLTATQSDCVFPVLAYGFPVQRSLKLLSDGRIALREPQSANTRSQDLSPVYHDAGMFYCFKPDIVLKKGTLWTDNTRTVKLNEMAAHDIDTLTDWQIAEFKYRLLHEES